MLPPATVLFYFSVCPKLRKGRRFFRQIPVCKGKKRKREERPYFEKTSEANEKALALWPTRTATF